MPYSKNPHKYPPELIALVDVLAMRQEPVILDCATTADANGRRVQMQSFLAAVERHAKELAAVLERVRGKATRAGDSGNAELVAAQKVHDIWEARSLTAQRWKVRVQQSPPAIVLERRQLEGAFADSLSNLLQTASSSPPRASAPSTAPVTDDQLSLLNLASNQLGVGKSD